MVQSYLSRATKVIGAGVDSALGAAERLSADGLMRQSIRDVDTAIARLQEKRQRQRSLQTMMAERQRLGAERVAALRDQARFALGKGRDDLAERAVTEQLAAEQDIVATRDAEAQADAQIAQIDATLADLAERRGRLEEAYRAEQAKTITVCAPAAVERRVTLAEEAFDRARAAKGKGRAATGLPVAEIDDLVREAAIGERLAELRASLDRPAEAKARRPSKPRR